MNQASHLAPLWSHRLPGLTTNTLLGLSGISAILIIVSVIQGALLVRAISLEEASERTSVEVVLCVVAAVVTFFGAVGFFQLSVKARRSLRGLREHSWLPPISGKNGRLYLESSRGQCSKCDGRIKFVNLSAAPRRLGGRPTALERESDLPAQPSAHLAG